MKGMRNRIAHGYFELDLKVVWDTVASTQCPRWPPNCRACCRPIKRRLPTEQCRVKAGFISVSA